MTSSLRAYCVLILLGLFPLSAHAQPQALTVEAWRDDIVEMVEIMKSNHPDLYGNVSQNDFDGAVNSLSARLDDLTDKEIIVEMAKIVALVEDGHTRLYIPRQHDRLAFSFSHSEPKKPKDARLEFTSLPLAFKVLGEGLYITRTDEERRNLLGAEVVAFGDMATSDVLKRLSAVNYNDNAMTDKLLAGDRAALPDVLAALDVIPSAEKVRLTLRPYKSHDEFVVEISPLKHDAEADLSGPDWKQTPLWLNDTESQKWAKSLKRDRVHYIQLNQIQLGDPDNLLPDFMREEVRKAKVAKAQKMIIDLRHNHGGAGGYARAVVNAIGDSAYNEFGKFAVLIGRETFSAAEFLVNELEQYTDVLFFGEGTGASPDTYGDPKRVQLENSGLDLRVSRLHWSTWRAFDIRDTTAPHFPIDYTIDDYMTGEDPVLNAAIGYRAPDKFSALVAEVFSRNDNWDGGLIILSRYLTDHRNRNRNFEKLAAELFEEGEKREAKEMYIPALLLYDSARRLDESLLEAYLGWARAAMAIDEKQEAINALETGLRQFPENRELRERLEAIEE